MVRRITVVTVIAVAFFIFPQVANAQIYVSGENAYGYIERCVKLHETQIEFVSDGDFDYDRLMDAGVCQIWEKGEKNHHKLKVEYTASREDISKYYKTLGYLKEKTKDLDDWGKVEFVNGYMQGHIKYGKYDSAVKTLSRGEGICLGYSLAFHQIAHEIGLEDRVIMGESSKELHSWNEVKIGDKWYGVDTCWGEITDEPDNWEDHTKYFVEEGLL